MKQRRIVEGEEESDHGMLYLQFLIDQKQVPIDNENRAKTGEELKEQALALGYSINNDLISEITSIYIGGSPKLTRQGTSPRVRLLPIAPTGALGEQPTPGSFIEAEVPGSGFQGTDDTAFATTETAEEHPVKYHPLSILYYFGSIKKPDWDTELEANVFESDISKEELVQNMDTIVRDFGPKLFVYSRKSETKEEFNELIQLQFCCLRNLARGLRTKSALVPISSLTDFANKMSVQEQPEVQDARNDFVEPLESVSQPDEQPSQVAPPDPSPEQAGTSQQVQISENEASEAVLRAYRDRPLGLYNKPVINPRIVEQTKIHHRNFVGPGNVQDPAMMYKPRYSPAFDLKIRRS